MNAGDKVRNKTILADARWKGAHGIGRFASEILSRLSHTTLLSSGPHPLSLYNLVWQPYYLWKHQHDHTVFFNPGFNAVIASPIPFVFVIHDLNHLYFHNETPFLKKLYYNTLIKYTARKAFKILTVSQYSKNNILDWIKIPEDNIIVVGCGVNACFTPDGDHHRPGYPYLLHVGNTKKHKNLLRLINAFSLAKINSNIRLILTGEKTNEIINLSKQLSLDNRIIFSGVLSDMQLADYYRGALAIMLPSLYEGFGLPIIEGMACGVPVLTSDVAAMPEVADKAALLVNPYDVNSLAQGIYRIVTDEILRQHLIASGVDRAKLFSWDKITNQVQSILESV